MKGEWRYFIMEYGALSVTTIGDLLILMLCASRWDMALPLVTMVTVVCSSLYYDA